MNILIEYLLLERLVANVTTVGRPDNIREASLEALGYICQDIVSLFINLSLKNLLPLGFKCTCTSK
jgi:hypothetical protein